MSAYDKVMVTIIVAAMLTLWTKCWCEVSGALRDNSWREQIASHGAAEFYLDGAHQRQWRWKDCR